MAFGENAGSKAGAKALHLRLAIYIYMKLYIYTKIHIYVCVIPGYYSKVYFRVTMRVCLAWLMHLLIRKNYEGIYWVIHVCVHIQV